MGRRGSSGTCCKGSGTGSTSTPRSMKSGLSGRRFDTTTGTFEQMTSPIKPFYLDLTDNEIQDIQRVFGDVLRSGQLILGKYTQQFESEFATYVGCAHAVSMNTATSVLEFLCAVKGGRVRRIAVASNTNFASVAAIIRAGGEPVFMDMTADYFVPDLAILEATVDEQHVDGVMWVHIGGIIAPDFADVVEY